MEIKTSSLSPILILGAHRSGTSLVTRLLEELGLFVGARLDENHEALVFSRMNTWVLESCGGRWDTPHCIEYLLENDEAMDLTIDYLHQRLNSIGLLEFLGVGKWLGYVARHNMPAAWGWKDPRNTITLPMWLKLFPAARPVHVVRNGVDVAESLYRRQKSGFREAGERYQKFKSLMGWRGKAGWFGESPRLMERQEGFALWEEYLDYAERFLMPLRGQTMQLRYEDFLADPEAALAPLAEFCGLHASSSQIAAACGSIRSERRYSFVKDPELYAFWESRRTRAQMLRHGYAQLAEQEFKPQGTREGREAVT